MLLKEGDKSFLREVLSLMHEVELQTHVPKQAPNLKIPQLLRPSRHPKSNLNQHPSKLKPKHLNRKTLKKFLQSQRLPMQQVLVRLLVQVKRAQKWISTNWWDWQIWRKPTKCPRNCAEFHSLSHVACYSILVTSDLTSNTSICSFSPWSKYCFIKLWSTMRKSCLLDQLM